MVGEICLLCLVGVLRVLFVWSEGYIYIYVFLFGLPSFPPTSNIASVL